MKKFMTMIMFVLAMFGVSYGAETADSEIYVRKEVFNVHMDSINSKFDAIMREMKQMHEEMNQMREEIKSLRQDLNDIVRTIAVLSQRIDNLGSRIDNLDSRMDDLRNGLYLGLVLLGILLGLPMVQKFLEWRDSRRPSITLEDVKRLIEESKSESRNA